jgi:hypothetical protein
MGKYVIVFEDPERPDDPAMVLVPSDAWLAQAMNGELPSVRVYWDLQDDQAAAGSGDEATKFRHDRAMWERQFTAERVGKLTEEQAMEYLILKDIPRHIFSKVHNRPLVRVVYKDQVPGDRKFRNAWRLAA